MVTMGSNSRKILSRRGQRTSSFSLPSTHGMIWILLIIVIVISCSLLFGALYIVNDVMNRDHDLHARSAVLEPGTSDRLRHGGPLSQNHTNDDEASEPVALKHLRKSKLDKLHNTQTEFHDHEKDKKNMKSDKLAAFKADFLRRYGDTYAEQIQKGVQRFGSVQTTAERLLRAAAQKRPFRMSFAGYSVTVGRGNFFKQSYPFRLQAILQPILQTVFDGLELEVINAAIGGIPSFPYAFCMTHFLGPQPDVVSWDFSMNENGRDNTAVMEAYVRQVQHVYRQSRPLFISLDTHKGRCHLLQQYAEKGWLPEALCVARAEAVFEKRALESFKSPSNPNSLPPGLQTWNEFGAPPSCPGRSSWHPKRQEHEMIAWMIAMDFVGALEYAIDVMQRDPSWKQTYGAVSPATEPLFPRPLSAHLFDNSEAVHKLLYGHEHNNGTPETTQYKMHDVSCRTNFLPATDSDKVLPNIAVSGLASSAMAEDTNNVAEPSDKDYESGWVLDVSKLERETKRKVERCGGLGYVDMKLALYGIPQSGALELWLPVESHIYENEHHANHDHDNNEPASHWFDSIVLCEANEKRSPQACQLHKDLTITVGGVHVPSSGMTVINGAGEYLKRPTCVHLPVPATSTVTSFHELNEDAQRRLEKAHDAEHHKDGHLNVGLLVKVEAAARVTRKDGACCLSHVAWELH